MIQWLMNIFGLSDASIMQGAEWTVRLAVPRAGWVAFVLLTAALALTVFIYRRERRHARPRYLFLLGTLRILSIAIAVFAFLRPLLIAYVADSRTGVVPVLIDRSLSMAVSDRYGGDKAARLAALGHTETGVPLDPAKHSRLELVLGALRSPSIDLSSRLSSVGRVKFFTFGDRLSPLESRSGTVLPEHLEPDARTTRLGDALRALSESLRGQSIAAVILFTDGRSNAGLDPETATRLYALQREGPFPIVAVGVGSPEPPRDLAVARVMTNERVLADDAIAVEVLVRQTGFDAQPATVQIYDGDHQLAHQTATLDAPGGMQVVRLTLEKQPPGIHRFTCRIPPLSDEQSTENNEMHFTVEVIDRKVRTLLMADQPLWEYRYLKNLLLRRPGVELSCWLQSADSSFPQEGHVPLERFPQTPGEILQFDLVILCGADLEKLSRTQVGAVESLVQQGGGLCFIAAPGTSLKHLDAIEAVLPVALLTNSADVPNPPTRTQRPETAFLPALTPAGRSHPLTLLADTEEANPSLWSRLPGFYWYQPAKRIKAGATVLLEHPDDELAASKQPVVAVQWYGEGRVLYLASPSTWRWRYEAGEVYFARFWEKAVRWLSTARLLSPAGTMAGRFFIVAEPAKCSVGDPVTCYARCLAEDFSPLRHEQVVARLEAVDPLEGFEPQTIGLAADATHGLFRGTIVPTAAGDFRLQLLDPDNPERTVASTTLDVTMPNLEYDDLSTNFALLRTLATVTGGRFVELDDAAKVPQLVSECRQRVFEERAIELWDTLPVVLVLASFLTAEWILRRRKLLP